LNYNCTQVRHILCRGLLKIEGCEGMLAYIWVNIVFYASCVWFILGLAAVNGIVMDKCAHRIVIVIPLYNYYLTLIL